MSRVIRNFDALALSDLRIDALSIAEAGYAALDVGAALTHNLRIEQDELLVKVRPSQKDTAYSIRGRNVFFVGIGKCAFAAAAAIEQILGDRLTGGVALDVSARDRGGSRKIEPYVGTHPLPSEANERATDRILAFLEERGESDIVLMLISGGGSTLLCRTEAPMTCLEESAIFKELTKKGATIAEINTVRKHLSRARGGGLAKAAYPAEVLSFIVSDVPGDDVRLIASGPTIRDSSTIEDARHVLDTYGISNIQLLETPKEETYFERVRNILFLTSQSALDAMRAEAVDRGYQPAIADDRFSGEAREIGRAIGAKLHDSPPGSALLFAGESTVTLGNSSGTGGRNQEMALAALRDMREGELFLPFASDGHDNTDAAGAISDALSRAHAEENKLSITDYLEGHRSYDFFRSTGDALITEYTGTNVSDLIIALKK
ncbi:DUF4147 domain-containing protein [Candidatus Kaiserbacteria bacterium]|nr:DUF4147 domain-containing protein [Candidatus Kaiserbacteria bacterium]